MSDAWRWLREHAVNIVAGLVVAYMLIPIAVIFVFSFNDPAGKYNFTWVGFTLQHWGNAFGLPDLNRRSSPASSWRCWRRSSPPRSGR